MDKDLKEKVEEITMTDYGEVKNEDYPRDSMISDLLDELEKLKEELAERPPFYEMEER